MKWYQRPEIMLRWFIWKDWLLNYKVRPKQFQSRVLESKISWKAASQDLHLLIKYMIAFDSMISLLVCQLLARICSQLHYFIYAFSFFLIHVVWMVSFLTPTNIWRLPVSLSHLTNPREHHITLAEGIRQSGNLAYAKKVGIETMWKQWRCSQLKLNQLRDFTVSLSEVHPLSKVMLIFDPFWSLLSCKKKARKAHNSEC